MLLRNEEHLALSAHRFGLRDGGVDFIEGEKTHRRGCENALVQQHDDVLDQLTLGSLVQSGKPVAKPEYFQDAPTCQNEAWIGSHTHRLARERAIDQHSALLAQSLVHLGSRFSNHWIDGVLDALWTHDPVHLLINGPLAGDNHLIGPQPLQVHHRLAPTDHVDRANAIVFGQTDNHAAQFAAGRRLQQPRPG